MDIGYFVFEFNIISAISQKLWPNYHSGTRRSDFFPGSVYTCMYTWYISTCTHSHEGEQYWPASTADVRQHGLRRNFLRHWEEKRISNISVRKCIGLLHLWNMVQLESYFWTYGEVKNKPKNYFIMCISIDIIKRFINKSKKDSIIISIFFYTIAWKICQLWFYCFWVLGNYFVGCEANTSCVKLTEYAVCHIARVCHSQFVNFPKWLAFY